MHGDLLRSASLSHGYMGSKGLGRKRCNIVKLSCGNVWHLQFSRPWSGRALSWVDGALLGRRLAPTRSPSVPGFGSGHNLLPKALQVAASSIVPGRVLVCDSAIALQHVPCLCQRIP